MSFDFLATREQTYDGIVALDLIEHFAKEELLGCSRRSGLRSSQAAAC